MYYKCNYQNKNIDEKRKTIMKKYFALLLALVMTLSLFSCSVEQEAEGGEGEGDASAATEITLWAYPVGGWGDQATVDALIADFETANPGIKVKVEYLTYADGDDKVNTAIEGNAAPDLIMEGPERLVANWGAKGKMLDISDMFDATAKANLLESAQKDCFLGDAAYEYPLCVSAFCMGINKTVFEAAGAMQYLNEETHTWNSVEDFFKAIDAVYNYTGKQVGAVFCVGQGGDQGTRELVRNIGGGEMTNPEHTEYLWNSEENINALKMLYDCEGIEFDPSIAGGDEIALFYNGTLNVAFCWNVAQQQNPNTANTGAGKTANGDEILFMAFPGTEEKGVRLGAQNYGFGIFDNGDQAKIDAAKTFIKYFCSGEGAADAVRAAGFFPADTSITGTYEGHEAEAILNEYNETMVPLAADYYQVTTGWAEARTAWWNMLQKVGASDGSVEAISAAVAEYCDQANGK